MSKRKSVIVIALILMVMTGSLYAARGYNNAAMQARPAMATMQRGAAFTPAQSVGRGMSANVQRTTPAYGAKGGYAFQNQAVSNVDVTARIAQMKANAGTEGRPFYGQVGLDQDTDIQARMAQVRERLLSEECPLGEDCPNIDGTNPQFAQNAYGRNGGFAKGNSATGAWGRGFLFNEELVVEEVDE